MSNVAWEFTDLWSNTSLSLHDYNTINIPINQWCITTKGIDIRLHTKKKNGFSIAKMVFFVEKYNFGQQQKNQKLWKHVLSPQ